MIAYAPPAVSRPPPAFEGPLPHVILPGGEFAEAVRVAIPRDARVRVVDVPEPGGALLLATGVFLIWKVRKKHASTAAKRHGAVT
jgi:hypothetical protein